MRNRLSRCGAKLEAHPKGLCQATFSDFEAYLSARGYARATVLQYLSTARRFGAWLRHPRKRKIAIDEEAVALFVRRSKVNNRLRCTNHLQSSLGHLLQMLRDRGEVTLISASPPTIIDAAIQKFASHMCDTCGFAEATCQRHAYYVRRFLEYKYGSGSLRWNQLCESDLVNFVGEYGKQSMLGAAKAVASALRKFLRHLQLRKVDVGGLVDVVPATPCWRLASLPRMMTEKQLHTLLSSFDRSTALGRRDYAMVMLMSTLGVRASEVAQLQLDDLNWRDASLRIVTPKTRRTNTLPLPDATGRAIANYLCDGRPQTSHRHVFARHCAPRDIPITSNTVRAVAIRAFCRCGFDPKWKGSHILRHTVATQLHQRGSTLKEVADLLGHRSIETSAVYAKVNLPALAAVAMPWPEVTT
jgi:integrase/recombinase XerD